MFDAIFYKRDITAKSKALLDALRLHHPEQDHRSLAEKIDAINETNDTHLFVVVRTQERGGVQRLATRIDQPRRRILKAEDNANVRNAK